MKPANHTVVGEAGDLERDVHPICSCAVCTRRKGTGIPNIPGYTSGACVERLNSFSGTCQHCPAVVESVSIVSLAADDKYDKYTHFFMFNMNMIKEIYSGTIE